MIKKLKYLTLIALAAIFPFFPCFAEDPGAASVSPQVSTSSESQDPPPVGSLYGAFPYGGKSLGPPPPATWPVLGASYSDHLPSHPIKLTPGSDSTIFPASPPINLSPVSFPHEGDAGRPAMGHPGHDGPVPANPPWMNPGQGKIPFTREFGFPGMASGGKMPFPIDSMPGNFPFSMHGPPPQGFPPGMMPGSPMASFPGMPFPGQMASFPGMALDPNDPCWGPCKQAAYDTYMASASGIPLPAAPPSEGSGARVTTSTFIALVQSQVKMIIVDTRTGLLDDGQRIPGAISISPEGTPEQINSSLPERNILVVTYSNHAGENSASRLANRLREMGYLNVIEYRDGFLGWLNSGQKVETKKN